VGERFYLSQIKSTGTCPGINPNKRRKRMAWTEEAKAEAISMYEEANPTPENSIEIVKNIAEELDETVNGVRMILSTAGVYVKKATKEATAKKSTRISKEDSQNALISAITDAGQEADEAIISKMTGKAAVYFKDIIEAINS